MKSIQKLLCCLLLLAAVPALADAPTQVERHPGWSFTELREIPIQSGGRLKPLDSFAREIVLFETGHRSYDGWDPVDLLISFIAYPNVWQTKQFIKVSRQDVRRELGLDENQARSFSPQELFSNFALLQYAQHMGQNQNGPEALSGKSDKSVKESPREQELRNVLDRIALFRDVVAGTAWVMIPKQPEGAPWLSLAGNEKEGEQIRSSFVDVLKAYQAGDESQFSRASLMLKSAIEGEVPNWTPHQQHSIQLEVLYNHFRPFQLAWIFYLLAALSWLAFSKRKGGRALALSLTGLAFLMHVVGFGIRCYIAGRPPVTNMYESIVWVCLGVVVFATILYLIQKNSITLLVACVTATVGLIAADSAPAMMDPGLHPLVPVLRSNYWLTVHVLTITLGYAAFALTLGLADVTLFQYFKQSRLTQKGAKDPALQTKIAGLSQLTYRAMQFGVVLLAAGTILGGVWADYSWGRFWGWDPKEVWALIALLSYIVILHGRMTNWIGQFAFAAWTVVGFLSVLMAWYGVNFILGVGLHSYGFSSGGTAWVSGFTALQLAYVGAIALYRKTVETTSLGLKELQSHPH